MFRVITVLSPERYCPNGQKGDSSPLKSLADAASSVADKAALINKLLRELGVLTSDGKS